MKINTFLLNRFLTTVLISWFTVGCSSSEVEKKSEKSAVEKQLPPSTDAGLWSREMLQEQLKASEPPNGENNFKRGIYAQLLTQDQLAERSYLNIVKNKKAPNRYKAAVNLTLLYLKKKKYMDAKGVLADYLVAPEIGDELGKMPDGIMLKKDLLHAFILFKEERVSDAIRQLEILLEGKSDYIPAYPLLAQIYLFKGSYFLANKVISRGLSFKKDHAELLFLRAYIFLKQNKMQAAREVLQQLLVKPKMKSLALNQLGIIALRKKKYSEAEGFFRDSHEAEPLFVASLNNLAITKQMQKSYEGAKELYLKILQDEGNVREVHYNLSVLYLYFLNNPQKAFEHFELFKKL